MAPGPSRVATGLLLATLAVQSQAAERCAGGNWRIAGGEGETLELICQGLEAASRFFTECGLEPVGPTNIRVVDALPTCFDSPAHAVFDPASDEITIATLSACAAALQPGDLFDRIDPEWAYRSIAAHEAAHAKLHRLGIGATGFLEQEYIAAVVQLSTLESAQREALMAGLGVSGPVTDQEITGMIYAFDPLSFAARAYVHHTTLDDPCGQLRGMVDGSIRLPRASSW